jgi:hypothetical protein
MGSLPQSNSHVDRLYVQVSQSAFGADSGILFRSCRGRATTPSAVTAPLQIDAMIQTRETCPGCATLSSFFRRQHLGKARSVVDYLWLTRFCRAWRVAWASSK